jgi:glycosyltransferase involved in cell wall biosynthesis
MRLIVTANIVPFMPGGADYHIAGIVEQLRAHGHEVELLRFPFKFSPLADIRRMMTFSETTELNIPNGVSVDKVVSLQFPSYGVQHDDHRVWLMHQHRAVYELYENAKADAELISLKEEIIQFDNRHLGLAKKVFANSQRVAQRLKEFNGIDSQALYHPPHKAEQFYCDEPLDYLFCPSRLESLKRQELIIRAAQHIKSPVQLIVAGEGGQRYFYENLISQLDVTDKVQLIGRFTEAEKRVFYARSLGVVFVPKDEDYGYITLEAMLSSKPVICCSDSGGPTEFIEHGSNGLVVEPDEKQLAQAIDQLYENKQKAKLMGEQGLQTYKQKNICWDNVVGEILS